VKGVELEVESLSFVVAKMRLLEFEIDRSDGGREGGEGVVQFLGIAAALLHQRLFL